MEIGQKVKRLYIDNKGNKHLSGQIGEIIGFTDCSGYPAANCRFFEFANQWFTFPEKLSVNLIDELEVL